MMYQFGNRMTGGRFYVGMGLRVFICLAVLALVVIGIVALVRYIRSTNHGKTFTAPIAGTPITGAPPSGPSAAAFNPALQILNERFARGELSDEEYKAKKAELLK